MNNESNLKSFFNLLEKLSNKKQGKDINTIYKDKDNHKNISFVLIASQGISRQYINYIKNAIQKNTNIFYLLAKGHQAIVVANYTKERLQNQALLEETNRYLGKSRDQNGKSLPTICIRLKTNTSNSLKVGDT